MSIKSIKEYNGNITPIFSLLQHLTNAPEIDNITFKNIINQLNTTHDILLYIKDEKPVGMITYFIEQKLIHGGKCVAHIEDLVVDKENRNSGIAKILLDYVKIIAKDNNCYKIILDCTRELIPFYEKSEFKEHEIQMSLYF